jgi:hypothetical protein
MHVDKSQVLDLLRQRGDDEKAREAESRLPDPVDPDADAGLLAELGVDPQDLISGLSGGALGDPDSGLGGMLDR